MARPLACPKCGASIALPDGSTVHVCACPQCGESIIIPQAPAADDKRHIGPAFLSTAAKKLTKTAPHGPREEAEGYPWHVKVVGALAAALIVGLPLYVFWPRDTWERDNHGKILSMCNEATALAKTGELAPFDVKRAAILALVGTRRVESQDLKAALQRVEDAGNILVASIKREAERVGQAEAARRQAEEEKQRFEAEARLAAEKKQRQKDEAERLALEEKKRQEDAEAQRRAEEEKQRLVGEARQNAEKERERLVAEANRRAEEEKQRKAEAQRQVEEQQRREAEAKQQAAEEQRRQEAIAALTTELGRITASLEQAKAEGRAAVQTRNQMQYQYNSERQQVEAQYQSMLADIDRSYKDEIRSLSSRDPNFNQRFAEAQRRKSERMLAAQAWRADQYREIDQRYQPQVMAVDRKIAQLEEIVKSLTQSQADLQNRLKKMR